MAFWPKFGLRHSTAPPTTQRSPASARPSARLPAPAHSPRPSTRFTRVGPSTAHGPTASRAAGRAQQPPRVDDRWPPPIISHLFPPTSSAFFPPTPPAMVTPPAPRFDRTSAIGRRQRVRNHPATQNPNLESAGTLHVSQSRPYRPPRRHGWGWL